MEDNEELEDDILDEEVDDLDDQPEYGTTDQVLDEPINQEQQRKINNRQKVDNLIDGKASQAIQGTGVPKPIADAAVKTNGGPLNLAANGPGSKMISNFSRNQLAKGPMFNNQDDGNKIQQVLNKKNQFPLKGQNQQEQTQEENQGIGEKLDKVGEKAVSEFGGKAITAATGGAVSGPAADAIAKTVAKPAGKLLKYGIFTTLLPILFFLLFICIPIFTAISMDDSGSSDNDENNEVNEDGVCSYNVGGKNVSNVKVRLLQCKDGDRGKPIEGEELVDLEKYILGVVYAEIGGGSGAGAKAQAVVARSYALTRTNIYGEKGPEKQSDGTWVVSLRNCTETQVYCDPDQGCTVKNGAANATGNTVYSGKIEGHQQYKGPMAANDPTRAAMAKVAGQVALNKNGQVVFTDYTQTQQTLFDNYAKQGKNYFEIIKKIYPKVSSISSNCTSSSSSNGKTGEFTNWKQCDNRWGNNLLGTSSKTTICKAGCAATSVSIQLAKSGVPLTFNNLNPGTFVKEYTNVGGFSGALIYFQNVNKVAPKFKYVGSMNISGSKKDKVNKLNYLANNGEYLVIGVYKSAGADDIGHWVAFDKASSDTVYINDPGQSNLGNKLFDIYPYTVSRPIVVKRYKVS